LTGARVDVFEGPEAIQPHPRPQVVPLGGMAILWLVLVDIPEGIELGGFSGGAVLTVTTALVCISTIVVKALARPTPDQSMEPRLASDRRRVPLALLLFATWATASAAVHTSTPGAQNVLVYDTFVGAIIACSSFTSAHSAPRYLPRINFVAWFVAVVYFGSVIHNGLGADSIYGPRSVALAGLVLVAVAISTRQRILAVVTVAMIGSTVSRTATVVAIGILFLGLALNSRPAIRLGKVIAWSAVALAAMVLAIIKIAPLHDRFLGGDSAFEYHGIRYNTSGRSQLWSYTWNLAHQHLLLGGGPGDAQTSVAARFGIEHPHNDYLRLLNDLGIFGLALFLFGLLAMLRGTWKRGRHTGAPIHWAAFLGLLGVGCAAITDNALVYPFVMVPLGVVVGLSLAHPVPAGPSASSWGDADPHADRGLADNEQPGVPPA
jgi:O-antigen ligase